ncbi:DoxX-like family protein [Archangium sp. Cb G35]|uniref:DoxX family protein n=1 Tax=Archangium sp. Cb G35 TaxID=1920190 RepID=UPI000937B95A|nr:DoxX family protein [Archangium sp. Cb G35]OJT18203.1 DoxX-like family protein [Archangium sp. Cb G35]
MSTITLSQKSIWTGRILSGLAVAFLLFDAVMKFIMDKLPPEALEAGSALQWPIERMPLVGTILLICLACYLIPRTAILGAILLTGYLGGAVASHVRVGNPLFSHTLFPIYVAVFLWLGLFLRDARVRKVLEP